MSPSKIDPMEPLDTSTPKPAIKGFSLSSKSGTKPLSFATTTNRKASPSSRLGKRPRAALRNDSEDDDNDNNTVQHEAVTGFDILKGGALKKNENTANGPLVIPSVKNRDWREEIRRNRMKGKNLLPPEVQAQRKQEGAIRAVNVEAIVNGAAEVQWGLTITKKHVRGGQDNEVENSKEDEDGKGESRGNKELLVERPREKTADEVAIEALMGTRSQENRPALIIHSAASDDKSFPYAITEEDAYRRAVRSAPDVSTLDDYERVPVEEFGAALLRGMGWKEGDAKKGTVSRPKEIKRRQNLLGLGATELKGAEELGAWVQKSDPKRLGNGGHRGGGERRPRANEYKEREDRKREVRDDRYGGSHRRDRDDYRVKDRDREKRR